MVSSTPSKRVVLTRTHNGNLQLAPKLRGAGLDPLQVDLLELVPVTDWTAVDEKLLTMRAYDWLIFTSAAAAEIFAERSKTLGIVASDLDRARIATVGAKTASALSRQGWHADFIPEEFLTSALARSLPFGRRALLMSSDAASKVPATILRERGFEVDRVNLYGTRVLDVRKYVETIISSDMVMFGSPSAVDGLCSQLSDHELSTLVKKEAACIGPITASAARTRGFSRIIQPSSEYTFDSLIGEIRRVSQIA